MCLKILVFSMFLFQATIADDYQGQDAYIGCFIDNRTARDLNKLPGQIGNVWIGSNSNMTVAACLDLCRGFSLPYAGLEFGNECYCGDSFGRYGKADESECSYSCSGNMNQMCGGLSRLSVYSVRILVRSELIVVVNVTQLSFSPIRAAQSQSPFDPSKFSWIEYSRESGEIHIYAYLNPVATTPTLITLNAIEPDLPSNTAYVFVSLRGNQLATFYNCRLADAKMIADSATMSALTQTFFSASTQAVFGQVIFNRNLNDVFRAYGCVNMRRDAYEQIYSPTTSSLVKDYCQLTLNDLQRVNLQMAHLIDGIANDRQSSANFFALISSNLLTCSMKSKKC